MTTLLVSTALARVLAERFSALGEPVRGVDFADVARPRCDGGAVFRDTDTGPHHSRNDSAL